METEISPCGNEMFVETQWLADHLNDPGLRIVDIRFARCFLPDHPAVAEENLSGYRETHIPGAVYIDCIADLGDSSCKEIYYVPHPRHFAEVMGRAGINNQTLVVCYDEAPFPIASARFWWMMLYFGHTRVKILEGGLRKWIKEGRPLSNVVPEPAFEHFTPKICESLRVTKEGVKESLNDDQTVIIDCLSLEQHQGKVMNRRSVRKGHIPGALCLPPINLLKGVDHKSERAREEVMANDEPYLFLPVNELRAIFAKIGVDERKRVITYCGKGDVACSVFLTLKMIGIKDAAVYEASLAEWTRDQSLPMDCSE